MPRLIEVQDAATAALPEMIAEIAAMGFNPEDEECLANAALWLRRLGNNRSFLGDLLVEELAQRHRADVLEGAYGPQVVMLGSPEGDFFMRAAMWPSQDEHMLRASGGTSFVYGMPHDHNFNFLTLGYFGPGYWSDYYEFDYEEVHGYRGEALPSLKFIERARLEEGKIQLYRAHLDVHAQHPADVLSVSINVMHTAPMQSWLDQYRIDLDQRTVGAIVSPGPSDAFIKIAVGLGSAEALDLAHRFAHRHPSDRMRLACWTALAGREHDPAQRDALWREAEGSGSRMVSREARARRAELALA